MNINITDSDLIRCACNADWRRKYYTTWDWATVELLMKIYENRQRLEDVEAYFWQEVTMANSRLCP